MYLAPGCKVYGPVVIGDDCVVGANAVVTRSFPEQGRLQRAHPAPVISGLGEVATCSSRMRVT